ncbi:2-trimethylaminoethylphosphonate dioxygenase [Kutzneria albida]
MTCLYKVEEERMDLPAVWLRDNCRCAKCRDPRTGQKLFDITDLPDPITVTDRVEDEFAVHLVFGPDGHRSTFDRAWLHENQPGRGEQDFRVESAKDLWPSIDPPVFTWGGPELPWLESVLCRGFAVLSEVPVEPGAVLRVAESFGYVRETNYGRLFHVRVEAEPNNLAFTGLPISPHTDNPYRDPVPTVQLLHCLENAVEGGETTLVDGFHAAAVLRERDPAAFRALSGTPVTFEFADRDAVLRASRPLIGVDPRGRIREIRFNNRSLRPLGWSAEEITEFYRAYRVFAELLAEPAHQVRMRLNPGDCLVFDNTRVLHARTGFADTGRRHLEGCYADLDSLASRVEVLRREPLVALSALFAGAGAQDYLGEEVTQAEHMLQAAARAEAAGAPDHLVAAALLHDIGHVLPETGQHHDEAGAAWLARWFGQEVTEPVRLHVAAKRYLCAVEPDYFGRLSAASVHTLSLQGGPMTAEQAGEFAAGPYAADAVAVRRWDEAAKDPALASPPLEHFLPVLRRILERAGRPG